MLYFIRKLTSALIATIIFSLAISMIFYNLTIPELMNENSLGRIFLVLVMFVLGGTYYALGIPFSILIDLIMRIGYNKEGTSTKAVGTLRLLGYLLLYALAGVASANITLHLFVYCKHSLLGDWHSMDWSENITFILAAWLFAWLDYLLSKLKLFSPNKHLTDSNNDV